MSEVRRMGGIEWFQAGLTGDEASSGGGEEQDGCSHLVRVAMAAQGVDGGQGLGEGLPRDS